LEEIVKILLLNTFDNEGGAARAAYRLHRALRKNGCDSQMLVRTKTSEDDHVAAVGPQTKLRRILAKFLSDRLLLQFYRKRQKLLFSPAFFPDNLRKRIKVINPNIIHLHWVAAGFLRIETLRYLNRPLVWTVPDSWAFTGGCHIPFDCNRYMNYCGCCPTLGSNSDRDLSHWVWKRKAKNWKNLNLTVVAPSHWMAGCVKDSSLFRDVRVEIIPNGLFLTEFKPVNRHVSRDILNLPRDRMVILFGAMYATSDQNKGFQYLKSALSEFVANGWAEKAELLIFGSSQPKNRVDFGMKCHYDGRLYDDASLSITYSAANVFVAPSIQENLPYTVMEALACGTPCVAFDIGGMSDLIEHQQNGYLAKPFDVADLARGISWVISDEHRWQNLSQNARQKIEKEFDIQRIAQRHIDLYKEIINSGF
jgi:glycosyltransferase involved in cell wall biosynthesis